MRLSAVVVALACALTLSAGPASAHGNHLSVDDQHSAEGTVVIETLFTSSDGFLVLRTDDGGEPGEPIGHAPIEFGFETGLKVGIDESVWSARDGPIPVWAVLHGDDGDGEFEPAQDEPVPAFGGDAEQRFLVGKRAAGPASVVAAGFDSQRTNGTVMIERVALGHDGAVVVRADRNDTPGPVVGRTPLPAGVHENVSVELDRSYYEGQNSRFSLWAALDERGSPVRLDGSLVASEFGVRKVERTTEAPGSATVDGSSGSTATTPAARTDGAGGASGADGPGFGVGVAVGAIAVAALARSRREG